MAVYIFASGVLLFAKVFSLGFVIGYLIAGIIFLLASGPGRQLLASFVWPKNRMVQLVGAIIVLVVLLKYCNAATRRNLNPYDDFAAYLAYPRMMLDSGTLIDPFSFRRMSAFGGQSALQVLTVGFLPWKYGLFLDGGVGLLILVLCVYSQERGDSDAFQIARFGLMGVAAFFPVPRFNTASELTTTVLMLTFLQSLEFLNRRKSFDWGGPLLVALLASALSTLRAQNVYAVGLMLVGHFSFRLWMDGEARAKTVRQAAATGAATCGFLLPWMMLLKMSSNTFIYPLFKGNEQASFHVLDASMSTFQLLRFLGGFYFHTPYLLLFLPLLFFARDKRLGRGALVMGVCNLIISGAMALKFTASDPSDLYRYLMPMGYGLLLYTCGRLIRQYAPEGAMEGLTRWVPITVGAMCAAVVMNMWFNRALRSPFQYVNEITAACHPEAEFRLDGPVPIGEIPPTEVIAKDYARALALVPRGAKVLAALDFPFLADYHEHELYNVDEVGIASPPPGLPSFQGPGPLEDYLLGQGVYYIAQTPSDTGFFINSVSYETFELSWPYEVQRKMARYSLDFMKNEDDLAHSSHVLYQSRLIRIIELKRP